MRRRIACEILETEKSYLASLEAMIRYYLRPLSNLARADSRAKAKTIFGNLEALHGINQDLLERLEARIGAWDDGARLGDVFVGVAPFFKMYGAYTTQYDDAIKLLAALPETDPAFHEEIERCYAEYAAAQAAATPTPLRLHHMLIMPVQRIPRYGLLLTDLIKKTPPCHPDFEDLNRALALVKASADSINKRVQDSENLRRLAETSSRGRGFKGLMEAHRKLLFEGVLQIQQSETTVGDSSAEIRKFSFRSGGEMQRLHFFLFNDILVFASEKDVARQKDMSKLETNWPLQLVWLQSGRDDSFRIVGPNKVFFVHSTPEEKAKWVPILTENINSSLLAHSAHTSGDLSDTAVRKGTFEFHPGAVYTGLWAEGRMCGQGTYAFSGNVYEGEWSDSQKHGHGVLRSASGEVYDGQWYENLLQGEGRLSYVDGSSFQGAFKEGHFASGTLTWANGDTYRGDFAQGVYHGHGTLRTAHGSEYTGEFRDGLFHGSGALTMSSGLQYKGQWRSGSRTGSATQQLPDGSSYEGEFSNDVYHGKGRLIRFDGAVYDGGFVEGRFEGKGVLTTLAALRYSGRWKNNMPHGKGELSYTNGESCSGNWKEGRPDGLMVIVRNGLKIEATFDDGILQGKLVLSSPSFPQPLRAIARSPHDFTVQVPGHPLPVFLDLSPQLPKLEYYSAFNFF